MTQIGQPRDTSNTMLDSGLRQGIDEPTPEGICVDLEARGLLEAGCRVRQPSTQRCRLVMAVQTSGNTLRRCLSALEPAAVLGDNCALKPGQPRRHKHDDE